MTELQSDTGRLQRFLADYPRLTVVSGAGISVAAGIPAYRDHCGVWQHTAPITHEEFTCNPARRRRYWARSVAGWPTVRDARPTAAHRALARLEQAGHIGLLITQNVDRLHQRAGSAAVVDLHGRVDRVRCMACDNTIDREQLQLELLRDNPHSLRRQVAPGPDGDSDVADSLVDQFLVPACAQCGGHLKPDVVFFGGSVTLERVQRCSDAVAAGDALLVVGSSLQVFSGFRFCRLAKELGKPVAIINPGNTRADPLADLKLRSDCQLLLAALTAEIRTSPPCSPSAAGSPS